MVNDPRVTAVLARLGGIYRDPARVDRDASSLLKSSVGSHLAPISATRVENNGHASTVLVLQGTIAIFFRGQNYQVLVDIYLPCGYPMKPPVPYVRLARNMYLTENHKHVGTDGQIYLPLLHEWKGGAQGTDNLIELVVAMASVFSNAPPVFTRAEPAPTSGGSAYRPESNSDSDGFPNPHINNNEPELSMSTREANLAIEAAEANAAAEAARAAESVDRQKAADIRRQAEDDRRVREAAAAQEQWEAAQTNRVRQRVVQKIQSHLADKSRQVTLLVQNDYRDQQRLQHATDIKVEQQMTEYEKKKADLTQHCETAEQSLVDIKEYIAQAELLSKEGKPPSADDMVVGSSPLHAQMIDLSCENAAVSDTLYFLDRALYQGHLDCLAHQKQVRLLAKQQFLVRAHLIKITQVLQGRNYTKTSNGY